MISFLKKFFLENWPRKLIALILSMMIWVVTSHSLSMTKTLHNVSVKVINIPNGKTIEGLQANNILNQKISLTLTGNKTVLENISDMDVEAVVDASRKIEEWAVTLNKNNIISLNPDIDVAKNISRVSNSTLIIKLSNLITEKIPIMVLKPIGEAPQGYQFLDIWPYQLYVTVSGPEETIKTLKAKGLKLRFNLNQITARELDSIKAAKKEGQQDEISFFVPTSWKRIAIPSISESTVEIDDPHAKFLRIDFIQLNRLQLDVTIPVTVFFPLKYSDTINPKNYSLQINDFIRDKNGIKVITSSLFARGVSKLFLDIVKDMFQIVIVAFPHEKRELLPWYVQFTYPQELEDLYVAKIMSESEVDEIKNLKPYLREEYLKNRFRNYMNSFRIFTPNDKKLSLKIELQDHQIVVTPQNFPIQK